MTNKSIILYILILLEGSKRTTRSSILFNIDTEDSDDDADSEFYIYNLTTEIFVEDNFGDISEDKIDNLAEKYDVNNLVDGVKGNEGSKSSIFLFDYHFPFMMYNFVSRVRRRSAVDFQTTTTERNMFQPEVKPYDMWLFIGVEVLDFFF